LYVLSWGGPRTYLKEARDVDFADQIAELAKQAVGRVQTVKTEEATKNGLVMPFIRALGYDVFNPTEVVPEFTADIGERKGEKVDYAILKDGRPIVLFECKLVGADLDNRHATQLQRYFHGVPDVKFGVLTDGVRYRFFSDLDRANVLDRKPFFEFDLLKHDEQAIEELKRFTKPQFNEESILSTAGELMYTREIQSLFRGEYAAPSRDLVQLLVSHVYDGRFTRSVQERFTPIVKQAFRAFINERINETLEAAKTLQSEDSKSDFDASETSLDGSGAEDGIVTTAEEIQGFYIVKAILNGIVALDRVYMRDVRSYCGIILDDNNRKPICRLHFNNPTHKQLGVFDKEKNEERIGIKKLDEIYRFANRIRAIVTHYEAAA